MPLGSENFWYSSGSHFERARLSIDSTNDRPKAAPRSAAVLFALLLYPALATGETSGADLSIGFKRSAPESARGREQVTYSLLVANAGPAAATAISVVTTVPQGVTFSSAGGMGWSCSDPVAQVVTCTLPSLVTGAKAALIGIAVTAPAQGGTFRAAAKVTATEADPVPGNNTAAESVVVAPTTSSTP
jgi:uncharacterized repeat protein (TIGR01451 family)